jgi:hypothetical protein
MEAKTQKKSCMKVFCIEPDIEQYQIIPPDSNSDLVREMLEFDGHPK